MWYGGVFVCGLSHWFTFVVTGSQSNLAHHSTTHMIAIPPVPDLHPYHPPTLITRPSSASPGRGANTRAVACTCKWRKGKSPITEAKRRSLGNRRLERAKSTPPAWAWYLFFVCVFGEVGKRLMAFSLLFVFT